MRIHRVIPVVFILLSGCATFQELVPVPPLQPQERGYIELKNDEEDFILQQDKKYFIKFPGPLDENVYLVLQTNAKRSVHNYFTSSFNEGQEPISKVTDEAADQNDLCLFPVNTTIPVYYWVIDKVDQETQLSIRYRYVQKWRFTVENKYDTYRRLLDENSADRREYNQMGPQYDFASLDAAIEQQKVEVKHKLLSDMQDELTAVEKLFPKNISASSDTMYKKYNELCGDTKEELKFQTDYIHLLNVIQQERSTKYNFKAFMGHYKDYEKFLKNKSSYRTPIVEHYKNVFLDRLDEAFPLFDNQLKKKDDISVIDLDPSIDNVEKLFTACGKQMPANLKGIRSYVDEFNIPAKWIRDGEAIYESAGPASHQKSPWPDNTYYPELIMKLEKARSGSPEYNLDKFDRYRNPVINQLFSDGIQNMKQKVSQRQNQFQRAADAVRQVNELKPGGDYKRMIQVLRANRDLTFLADQYPDLDGLMMKSISDRIRERLNAGDWVGSEEGLYALLDEQNFLNASKISAAKLKTAQSLESELFERIKKLSYERVDNFAKMHESTINNVEGLYADSSFLPVYTLIFSSESPERAAQKRRTIENYLNEVKTIRFPEKSIKNIYSDLTKAPRDHGVDKAHAVLAHAKYYNGQDKSVRNIIDECDPRIAKPLVKAKEYRRILVVPVNDKPKATNEYMLRINVKIPSDAKFPVYDINIKVPPAIAEKAGSRQWFTQMLLNKKVIKTEGHMRITAPSADNNYEAQITPVDIPKDGENIIEVQFNYPAFQLFEVSVMAQVPIIRKN
ncbi:MAG: hypothetical protein JXA06_04865 [Bacteroidetes bacterium]|nr:hypothetical protein [Bacteroidota bacterium]